MSQPLSESVSDVVDTTASPKKRLNWLLVILYCTLTAVGGVGAPLIQRLYYNHGGSSKWLSSLLLSVGFIAFAPPITFHYFKTLPFRKLTNPNLGFFMDPKLTLSSAGVGFLVGFVNYFFSTGLSSIPVSTATLLFSTQLAFTALFARLIVKQKFTFYSLNSVVVIILGAVVLALHASGDRPLGETRAKYFLGFMFTLLGAVFQGLMLPLVEIGYNKSNKPMSYVMVFQYQFVMNMVSSFVLTAGMLISKDYKIISKEASEFGLGEKMYVVIIIASALICQIASVGSMGLVSCTSALFAGIFNAVLVPLTEIASVIAFGEKFSGSKGMSLALCLWGFTSYFVGEYKKIGKPKSEVELNKLTIESD